MFANKKNETPVNTHPWKEDPLITFKNFLGYADGEADDLKVLAYNGNFYPLSTALSMPLYFSKITIRNIENTTLHFNFEDNVMPNILGIDTDNVMAKKNLQIAYRNIFPRELPQAPVSMRFHEYLIDGNNYNEDSLIQFTANSDYNKTPIKIVLENCKGYCVVKGLDSDAIARVFENKCNEHNLVFEQEARFRKKL